MLPGCFIFSKLDMSLSHHGANQRGEGVTTETLLINNE